MTIFNFKIVEISGGKGQEFTTPLQLARTFNGNVKSCKVSLDPATALTDSRN